MAQFQTQVNIQPAPAVAGDFASTNPRAMVLAGPGSLVAGAAGVTVGRFAWAVSTGLNNINTGEIDAYNVVNSSGAGVPTGFVHREQQALITAFLGSATQLIPQGLPVILHSAGDFWVKNEGTVACTAGMKVYANNATGACSFNVTATPPTSGAATGATLLRIIGPTTAGALPTTNTCTGSMSVIAGVPTLTVTAVGAGCALSPGQILSGTNVAAGTTIVAQMTGTVGSTGTYQVSISQTVASTPITMSGGTLTLTGGNTSGVFAPGMTISGTNIPAGTTILALISATGGAAGTYWVSTPASVAATASTITAANAMVLIVDASSTGIWALNDLVTGAGVATGTTIIATGAQNPNLTGLGGAGTYLTNTFQTAISAGQVMGVNAGTETKWVAMSNGAVGELVKISSWLLG